MTDTNSTDDGSSGDAGTGAGTQAAEGFVPVADLEREQARARDFQATADRAKAALADLQRQVTANGKPEADEDGGKGFDPDAFARSMMESVSRVTQLAQSVATLKEKFPLADKAIFDRLDEFGNVDALYLAVEASHQRVSALVSAERERIEADLRKEFGEKHGGAAPPADGNSSAPAGDPSVEQLKKMSMAELRAFEAANPGVADRVLRSAQ